MHMHSTNLSDHYIIQNGRKLHYGYTTGSCAAAAAKSAAHMLLLGGEITEVNIITPMGISLFLGVEEISRSNDSVTCAIRKYAGDDPDVTNGILIYAAVSKSDTSPPEIVIDGGCGIGRVTKKGLDQPIGNAAINRVPREMIKKEVKDICIQAGYQQSLSILIEAPEGASLSEKTFNPRLGILGGISILGTSGIVIPMSEDALLKSIETEIRMRLEEGETRLLVTPGNYGEDFVREQMELDVSKNIHCSNFVGQTLDMAVNMGAKEILFVSHIGKFIKVAGGIMDTHSRNADCRAEILSSCAIRAGAGIALARHILETVNTQEGIILLKEAGLLPETMEIVMHKIGGYLHHRTKGAIEVHVVVYSFEEGKLGEI